MPLITLLTDFGTADSYVAEVKGVLLSRVPEAHLVDVTHDIPAGDIRSGAYVLGRTWHRFPEGTVHLAVVDPGVGTRRPPLAFQMRGHGFVGPDNGLFTRVLMAGRADAVRLPVPDGAAPTFHGRDLFAPAAAAMAAGTALEDLGSRHTGRLVQLPIPTPRREGQALVGQVVYIDRFGTLVTNLSPGDIPPGARITVGGRMLGPLRRTFADVAPDELLAYAGSDGAVEIARRGGSAAAQLGLSLGAVVTVVAG